MKRRALLIAAIPLTACGLVAPSVSPEAVPVPIVGGGPLTPVSLTLYSCTVVIPEIHFSKHEPRYEALRKPIGAARGDGWNPQPGVPLRLAVNFYRVPLYGGSPEASVLWRSVDSSTQIIESWGNDTVARMFKSVTLPAGRYRVEARLAEGAQELAELHPTFLLYSTFKITPSIEQCQIPAVGS